MNLIEKLGGYDRASKIANCKSGVVHPTKPLLDALLEYRRANNIFEVGDLIIFGLIGNGVMMWDECLRMFLSQGLIRHATDAEIKAGHRIIHPTDNLSHLTDHCTDIRNHISPNTIVLDSDVINFDLYISMRSK